MRPTIYLLRGNKPPQNPDRVPFKMQMPMELKNRVSSKGSRVVDDGCLQETTMVLSCLQENNYEDTRCLKEAAAFRNCFRRYLTNNRTAKDQAAKGILTPYEKNLKYNQLNILMKRYPHM